MVENGDLFEENGVKTRKESNRSTMTDAQKTWKLEKIKEIYRMFQGCLLGKAREKWMKVLDQADKFDEIHNYAADNKLSVTDFEPF